MKTPMIFDDFSFLEKLFIRLINLLQSAQKTCSILSRIKLILKETNFFNFCSSLQWKLIKSFYSLKINQLYLRLRSVQEFLLFLTPFNNAKQIEINFQTNQPVYCSFLKKFFIRLINLPRSTQKTCSIISRIKLILEETNFLFNLWLFLQSKLIKNFYSSKPSSHISDQEVFRSFYSLLTLFNDAKQI
jgi:hypothetical protein